jgi:hypothetical protein
MPYRSVAVLLGVSLLVAAGASLVAARPPPAAQPGSRYFPETGHTVQGRFLEYWDTHGGLAQNGYPLSEEFAEISSLDNRPYTVQYFERAVFEHHPENAPPYDVLLSLLGLYTYHQRYSPLPPALVPLPPPPLPGAPPPTPGPGERQHPSTDHPRFFPETGHTLGGPFRAYWESHGGLMQQGYPLSDEFTEISDLDGQPHTVQYFERAVFELHPEHAGTPYEVLLAQLGTTLYRARYATPPLSLPPPAQPGGVQREPHGSDSYLVWTEESALGADILGLNLRTQQPLVVIDAPGDQTQPAIAGTLVVWETDAAGDPPGQHDILGKDLATNQSFAVATGAPDQILPAIAGQTVAWVQRIDLHDQIWLADRGGSPATAIAVVPDGHYVVEAPVLSDAYVAWIEATIGSRSLGLPIRILAFDRRTHAVQTVADLGTSDETVEHLLLDGSRLVWNAHLVNLASGDRAELPAFEWTAIQGDTLVGLGPAGVVGLQRSTGRVVPLVVSYDRVGHPALAGPWLVWEAVTGPNAGRLESLPLGAAFAGAGNPLALPLPTPRPTPAAVTGDLAALSLGAPDIGAAVGPGGTVLFWDGGDRWQPAASPTRRNLTGVSAASETEYWAVGDDVILHGGMVRWEEAPFPGGGQLTGVSMTGPDDGWAVGRRGEQPLALHYQAGAWQAVPLPFSGFGLNSVQMLGPASGWAAGDDRILRYDGTGWRAEPVPAGGRVLALVMASATQGWAVGEGGRILHYGGGQWAAVPSPVSSTLRGVALMGADEGWAVGDGGTILHLAGGAWQQYASPTTVTLRSVWSKPGGASWIAGDAGTTLVFGFTPTGQGGWTPVPVRPYPPDQP